MHYVSFGLTVLVIGCGGASSPPASAAADAAIDGTATVAVVDGGPEAGAGLSPPGGPCATSADCAPIRCACQDGGTNQVPNVCQTDRTCVSFPVCTC